jgi:ADP-heptose:LPS heptosyltransferase
LPDQGWQAGSNPSDGNGNKRGPWNARAVTFQTKRRIDYWFGGFLLMLLFPLVRLLGLVLRRDHSLARRKGCAIIKMAGGGSLFLAMPSLQAIRQEFPAGKFFLIGTRAVTSVADDHDWFDACWIIDDSNLLRLSMSLARALWNAARNADHLIDLEVHSRLTTALSVFTMIRNRIGFVDEIVFWRRGFYTHMTYFNTHGPVYAFYDLLAEWFGVVQVEVSAFHSEFRQRVHATRLPPGCRIPRAYIAVGHACSDLAKERQLTPQEWKRVLHPLSLSGYAIVFLGSANDAALADAIIAELGAGENLCGQLRLIQTAKVIARASIYYGIDSMLLHFARALSVKTISVWGPTDPATRLRPTSTTERIAYTRMPCSPCVHVNESPPCQGRRDCIALAVESLVTQPQQNNTVVVTPPPVGAVTGWDVDSHAGTVRAASIHYA